MDKDQKGYLTKQDLLRVLSTVPPDETQTQTQHLGNGSANNSIGPQRHPSISHNSMSNSGTWTNEDGNKVVQEAERLQRIQEKVEHILQVADMNHDGVIR